MFDLPAPCRANALKIRSGAPRQGANDNDDPDRDNAAFVTDPDRDGAEAMPLKRVVVA